MIPYMLHKEHHYASTLACYENGAYPYLEQEIKGVQIVFVKRIFKNRLLDGLWFLWRNRKRFDVLQTYHLRFSSLCWLIAFRLFSPKHKTYLKLDANEHILNYRFKGMGGKVNKMLLRSIDMVSVETTYLQQRLSEQWKLPVALIPNGCSLPAQPVQYADKKQLILTTGRIGIPVKRNELLLEAFADFAPVFPAWSLQLSGAVAPAFEAYIASYFLRYPQLRERVHFTGMIGDRNLLFQQYATAKIFCLCSETEGFPLALLEAASAGCYLITTDILAAPDITGKEKYGRILREDTPAALAALLKQLAADETVIEKNVTPLQEYAAQHFSWASVAGRIDAALKSR